MEHPIIQIIITLIAIPITGFVFQRFVNKADATKKELDDQWKDYVKESFKTLTSKVTSYCTDNHKEHDELYTARNILEKRVAVIENTHHQRGCDEPFKRRTGDQ